LPISLKKTGATFIAMPGHKGLYGPQGTGILLCREGGEPLLYGGTGTGSLEREMPSVLPDRLEAGTHNVCGIAGLAEGIRYVRRRGRDKILQRERALTALAIRGLSHIEKVRLYTGQNQTGVLSFAVAGRDSEEMAQELGRKGICVRAGLHCAPLAHESGGTAPGGTVRLSLSDRNREEDVYQFLGIFKKMM
jgi:selenocysteine lyase/cysteine desulfurase